MLRLQLFRWLLCLQTCILSFIVPVYSQISKGNIHGESSNAINKGVSNNNNNLPTSTTVPGKSVIDSAAIANWYDLKRSEATVSPNGKYFLYPVYNLPTDKQTLVVQSTQDGWKKEFIGTEQGFFSFDSKYAIFQLADTLFFLTLGKNKMECVNGVSSFTYPVIQTKDGSQGFGRFIAYKLKQNHALSLRDLVTDKQFTVDDVSNFQFNKSGNAILIKRLNKQSSVETLEWVDAQTKQVKQIWSNKSNGDISISSYAFDDIGGQAVLLIQDKNNKIAKSIWYYTPGMQQAHIKVNNELLKRKDGMFISSNALSFSKNGKYIFFELQRQPEISPTPDHRAVQVDVWNYKDPVLQPLQQYYNNKKQSIPQKFIKTRFASVLDIGTGQVKQLENDTTVVISSNYNSDFVITSQYLKSGDKRSEYTKKSYFISFLSDGISKYLTSGVGITFYLSPNKQYLVYFDSELKQYISYDIEKGKAKNITESISVKLTDNENDEIVCPNPLPAGLGIAGWLAKGDLLISDNYDLWMVDPSGKNQPENITHGYGRANNIKLDLIVDGGWPGEKAILPTGKPLLLKGFWENTKQNGFYKVDMTKRSGPQLISLHNCLITFLPKQISAYVWIVKKQTMFNAPNFYITNDFKSFKQLTDIQPQKKYRWATNELLTWKMPDGRFCQGVLYEPEDFDVTKKYPVIFYYYQKESDNLHEFLAPELIDASLNIPWFVSRGYFVFTPDIHYTVGCVAKSVVNSIVPGAHALLKRSYVDSLAMGLQGHSFGGYETNVLITESNLFAAAAEGAGACDLISQYGSILPTDRNNGQGTFQQEQGGQHRMKGLLWGDKGAYIENSPIFKADKVTTPLLIMHNKGDQAVPWGQAVELFIALRRLDKAVWMLQYDEGGHGVETSKDQMDFTIRMTQYFDHYLKGAPAPKWMTGGIPASMKGIATGYTLDSASNCHKDCTICKKWNNKSSMAKEE